MVIKTQPSLYLEFEKKCAEEHRSVSEVIREFMSKYAQGWILNKQQRTADMRNIEIMGNPNVISREDLTLTVSMPWAKAVQIGIHMGQGGGGWGAFSETKIFLTPEEVDKLIDSLATVKNTLVKRLEKE